MKVGRATYKQVETKLCSKASWVEQSRRRAKAAIRLHKAINRQKHRFEFKFLPPIMC